jgi:tetratricopeptide (TPR) repeat protein
VWNNKQMTTLGIGGAAELLLVIDLSRLVLYRAQALLHTLAGRHEKASEAAQEAIELSDRVRYPAGEAAAIEAAGIVGPLPGALTELERAHEAWQNLGRPLRPAARPATTRG